jgi:predicted nucleic acid-binding protein
MPSILVDTNVLVYLLDARDARRQERAIEVLVYLEEHEKGALSVQSLSEFASTALKKLEYPPNDVIVLVDAWRNAFPVYNLTPQIILEATRGVRDHQLSYYDAQIWASARLNQIPVILSEDFQDGQSLEGVRFVNPFADEFTVEAW